MVVLPGYLWVLICIALILTVAALLRSLYQTPSILVEIYQFIAFEPNPLMQAVYISLVCGIFYLYVNTAFPVISEFHRNGAWAAVLLTLGVFGWACASSPTIITKANQDRLCKEYKPDGLLYPDEERVCKTCKVKRCARSKHCVVCDHCVAGFDHHCVWLNVCISQSNKFQFLAFLIATILLCLYCIIMCVDIVVQLGVSKGLLETPVPIFQFLALFALQGGIYFSMTLMTTFCGLGVLIFFAWHFRLVCLNLTTNEYVKRSRYSYLAGRKGIPRHYYDLGLARNLKAFIGKTKWL